MDETKLDNKLASFFAKVKKLVVDYMTHTDQAVAKCERLCAGIEEYTGKVTEIENELASLVAEGDEILAGLRGDQ